MAAMPLGKKIPHSRISPAQKQTLGWSALFSLLCLKPALTLTQDRGWCNQGLRWRLQPCSDLLRPNQTRDKRADSPIHEATLCPGRDQWQHLNFPSGHPAWSTPLQISFETRSAMIFQSCFPKCWYYRHGPPHPASNLEECYRTKKTHILLVSVPLPGHQGASGQATLDSFPPTSMSCILNYEYFS